MVKTLCKREFLTGRHQILYSRQGVSAMTDIQSPLNYEIIEKLFKDSVCLTYDPMESSSAWQYYKQLAEEYKKEHNVKYVRACSKTAKIGKGRYNTDFHYFSDGTLVHCCDICSTNEEHKRKAEAKLQRIINLLKIRGYQVKKIYGPQKPMDFFSYSDMMRHISERALQIYSYIDDLSVEDIPNIPDFVKECFAGGNVLLTACKDENLPAEFRKFAALFADGKFFISEDYASRLGTGNNGKIYNLKYDYLASYPYCAEQFVPQEYINALYEKAQEFSWYAKPEEISSNRMSVDELIKMNKYIDELFKNRACLTAVNPDPDSTFMVPDFTRYAVFSDGLTVSGVYDENSKAFMKDLHRLFPNLDIRIEKVPNEYITQIYNRLHEFQKSASEIYIEMLKQKARKLKRLAEIPHHEALDVVAQMAGWRDWRSIKIEDEMHARQLIDALKWHKNTAASFNAENPLAEEWRQWQKKHKK